MYEAIICRLANVRAHPNAQKIQLATVFGYQIIVGLDAKEGTPGILFPEGGQLSHEFCHHNNLYKDAEQNIDPKAKTGFFDSNRRVRAQNFRGQKSEAFWCPLDHLDWTGNTKSLKEGFTFTEINGQQICQKYFSKKMLQQMARAKKQGKGKQKGLSKSEKFKLFHRHYDTKKLRHYVTNIPAGALLYFTEKVHGCVDRKTVVDTLEEGPIAIGEIVDNKLPLHIKTYNTELNTVEFIQPEAYYLKENHGDWYEIELENGSTIQITGNNPIWLPLLECYRRADEIQVGDTFLVDIPD